MWWSKNVAGTDASVRGFSFLITPKTPQLSKQTDDSLLYLWIYSISDLLNIAWKTQNTLNMLSCCLKLMQFKLVSAPCQPCQASQPAQPWHDIAWILFTGLYLAEDRGPPALTTELSVGMYVLFYLTRMCNYLKCEFSRFAHKSNWFKLAYQTGNQNLRSTQL